MPFEAGFALSIFVVSTQDLLISENEFSSIGFGI
jgi:hypothetical protein